MDLFTLALNKNNNHRPLADRMRPRNIDEIFGQKHIIGQDKLLSKLIKNDNLTSLILYGPPGVGKTSIAHVISKETKCEFVKINATSIGVKEIRECIDNAESLLKLYGRKTIFFIDEIHALKKGSQQDALLDAVEKGNIILIGATTENPYFDLNGALLSRTKVFQLEPLSHKEIVEILENVLNDKERGYGNIKISVDAASLLHISELCGGDARNAISTLELAVLSSNKDEKGIININKETIEQAMQKSVVNYDATGDNHYDIISAFIKSIRGSDADAALYCSEE
jgi:putative ATPase